MGSRCGWRPQRAKTGELASAVGGVALAVACALHVAGCTSCSKGGAQPLEPAELGALAPVSAVDAAPYLAVARSIVTHAPRPVSSPPAAPGDRVFVTAWVPGEAPVRATGLGATLLDSVTAAADALPPVANTQGLRFEIDALVAATPASLDPKMRERVFDVGLSGYLASDGPGKVGWVLPSEILFDRYVDFGGEQNETLRVHGEKITDLLAARAHTDPARAGQMHVARFSTDAWLEPATVGAAPIHLVRGMPPAPTAVTPDALIAAVRAGADYLARVVDDHGVFTYLYDPANDHKERGYSLLRHAGSVYALMEAYDELRVIEWQQKAASAIAHLKTLVKPTADGGVIIENADEEQQKVGANGLFLVALVKYAQATGDLSDLPTMRELARYIVHQQYGDGHFRDNADVMHEDEASRSRKLKKEIYYYAGEATLGLVRLYALDPDEKWLAAARKSADFIVHVRDAHDDLKTQIHDHWLSYALHDLYVVTHDQAYAGHADKIAQAIFLGEKTPQTAPHPDYVGAFYDEGQTTPTSTRLEALASAWQLARFTGADETKLHDVSLQLACFMRGQQLDAESVYFARNAARAIGGVREGVLNDQIRIDYPQHAMSAWLRVAHLLRDPQWGRPSK